MKKGAIFSHDRKHRFLLWRKWSKKPKVLYIGINPSIGNAKREDVTLHKLIKLTKHNGYGGFYIANLHSKVGQEWEEIKFTGDLIRDEAYLWIRAACKKVKVCCLMVGQKGYATISARSQMTRVTKIITKEAKLPVVVFRLGRKGAPVHPLMMATDMDFVPVAINYVSLKIDIIDLE